MNKDTKDVYEDLGAALATRIMEATGRFEFQSQLDKVIIFWDNQREERYSIRADWNLEKLMVWITKFYSEDFMRRGKLSTQREMRKALGLDS